MSVLEGFGVSPDIDPGVLSAVWGSNAGTADHPPSPTASLQKWLSLLPKPISQQVSLALGQERPFMPPDVTPEMMAEPNEVVPSMNHIEIIYRCIHFAMEAGDYGTAAALVYVVDRACYRFGRSAALLHVVDMISRVSHDTPIAPQVILRQARLMKDSGDLHTALRVLDGVINREQKWDYKTQEQYENTKAVCVQIKGQILHNLGLWKEAVLPLVESVLSFQVVNDDKGTSSSLALLSRCLKKLGIEDYAELRQHLHIFQAAHPCYEAYEKGREAVRLIENLGSTVYVAHNQLVADESLLMFIIQQTDMPERQKLDQYQVIVEQMKHSLDSHRTVRYLQSLEVYLAFVRSIFMISLTLAFSPVTQDKDLARFLEKLSLELYSFMCQQAGGGASSEPSAFLNQNQFSVRLMNSALAFLGLPTLEGSKDVELNEPEKKWSEIKAAEKKNVISSSSEREATSSSNKGINYSSSSLSSESSLPSSQSASSGAKLANTADGCQQPGVIPLVNKAATFPSTSRTHLKAGKHLPAHRHSRQTFVGNTMSKDDLLSATCPALSPNFVSGNEEILEASKDHVDIESLVLSATAISSATASGQASSGVSGISGTVDRFATTKSTSSATTQSSSEEIGKEKKSGSETVDQFSTTKSTSSATTEKSADVSSNSSSNNSGLSPSGSSNIPPTPSLSGQGSKSSGASSKQSSGTVDLEAETDPSSTSGSSQSGQEGEELSPLVDISSACALMSDLELGSSVETDDSSEFLANFIPSDNKDVHRAVLMSYNPVMGQWSAQTTLAYKGPQLVSTTKGSNRDVFHVSFLHQDEPLGRYVGKRYRVGRKAPEVYMQDVVCQMLAGFYVTRFNQALQHCPEDILQVQFLSAAHLQFLDKDGKVFDWINVEPFLHGSFLKLTNNLRFVSKKEEDQRGVDIATALSHFTYKATGGVLMMVDLQGWIPVDGKGVVYLTDPVFHTSNMRQFSSGDRHNEGMQAFWTHQHRKCNAICKYLGLDKDRPDAASV